MAFLEVVTRHMAGRPNLLRENQASLVSLTDSDWTQSILFDPDGKGTPWANRQLSRHRPIGRWVWVLDDDDVCTYPDLLSELKRVAATKPETRMIVAKADVTTHVGYPVPTHSFGQRPTYGDIAMPCLFFRSDCWKQHSEAWPETLAADYHFSHHVFESVGPDRVAWLPLIVAQSLQNGQGKPE